MKEADMWKYSMCLLFSCPKDNNKYQRSFIWNLKEMGYEVKQGKHLAIKAGGMKKFRRLDTLDESLSVEQIEETLAAIQGKDTTVTIGYV
ncbi:MAG: hypothetical protein ACLUIP_11715 [Anaerobutyricum hallii]